MATLESLERLVGKARINDPHQIDFNQLDETTAHAVIFVGRAIRGLPRPESDVAMQMFDAALGYVRLHDQVTDYDQRHRFSKALQDIGTLPVGQWPDTISTAFTTATTATSIRKNL